MIMGGAGKKCLSSRPFSRRTNVKADLLLVNVGQLAGVTQPSQALSANHFAILANASLAAHQRQIVWIGPNDTLPPVDDDCTIVDAHGHVVIPGLVDSHTHLLYAGDRVEEFEWRLAALVLGNRRARRRHQHDGSRGSERCQ